VDSVRQVCIYTRSEPASNHVPTSTPKSVESLDDLHQYGPEREQYEVINLIEVHNIGYDGSGVLIGYLDSGFNTEHSAFAEASILATWDFINDDEDVADGDALQMDHGTKVLSQNAAYAPGQLIGVAYNADFVLAKTEIRSDEIQVEEDFFVAGLEWCDSIGVDIVSSSLGYPDFYIYEDLDGNTTVTTKAVDIAASHGILVVTAAGNEGNNRFYPWIIPPGDADSALTVGAVYASGTKATFSSIGPTADGRIKPDVMAVGVSSRVADDVDSTFTVASGTSYATPQVAGVCALLLQKDPTMTPMDVIERMRETASDPDAPDNEYGYGIINASLALDVNPEVEPLEGEMLAYPNPFDDQVTFVMPEGVAGEEVEFWIYTVSGDQVFSGSTFLREFTWGGTNQDGEAVAGGVYICLAKTGGKDFTTKIARFTSE
jgi:subtilisin family serine protease